MEQHSYKVTILDDYDHKLIRNNPFMLVIDASTYRWTERICHLFLKKRDLHFRSLTNLNAYIKKFKIFDKPKIIHPSGMVISTEEWYHY